ncbi:MAG: hypothetical protein Q9207_003159 [Kuettlingeria erythrocarpa]
MSPGRTIVIHRRIQTPEAPIAYISAKVISLKATPLAMASLPEATPFLLVTAMDRRLRKISVAEGHTTHTVKIMEYSHSDLGVMSRLSVGTLSQQSPSSSVVVGFSPADRSIRLYVVDTGSLLAVKYGQTAVSDLALGRTHGSDGETVDKIITTGLDGTIILWSISTLPQRTGCRNDAGDGDNDDNPHKLPPPSTQHPLRRILSKARITQFIKSSEKEEEDTPTSSRSLSPSRIRRKSPKFAASNRSGTSETLRVVRASQVTAGAYLHRSKTNLASPPLSPRTSLPPRSRRSSLDEGHRGLARRCSINITTKELLDTLRDYRKQLTISKESLSLDTMHTVQRELHFTLNALSQKTRLSDPVEESGSILSESFDDRLAKMIDNRLALRFKSEDEANLTEGSRETDPLSSKAPTS